MERSNRYRNFAFISYSHRDMAVAKWLQRRLEGFRLPTEVHNDIDSGSRYLRPVFRDQSDLNTGVLGEELHRSLEESKFLIVICSVNSAASQWVSDETKAFVGMGRLSRIIPVIIPDKDTAERDLFPAFLRDYFAEHPERELLGINIGEVGKQKALIRVVSRMLDVSFDSLWKRHQRRKRVRIMSASLMTAAACVAAYLFAVPVKLSVDVELEKSALPVDDTVVLTVDGAEYTSSSGRPEFGVVKLPGYKRFSDVDIRVSSAFFTAVDTCVPTGMGVSRTVSICLGRDDSFALFGGYVYDADMEPISGVTVLVAGHEDDTDADGSFLISLPLSVQKTEQTVRLVKSGYDAVVKDSISPGAEQKFIMLKSTP